MKPDNKLADTVEEITMVIVVILAIIYLLNIIS